METSRIFFALLARGRRALIVRLGVYNQRTERGLTAEYAESKRIRLRNSELCDLWVSVVLRLLRLRRPVFYFYSRSLLNLV